jgi:hypothetical protein
VADEELQFDRVDSTSAPGTVVCSSCQSPIADAYYSANGKVFCRRCKAGIETALTARGNFWRGILFGLGGALVGSIVYFAVTAITGYELSLITILIGWLVGRAVQRGSGAIGGRRYQLAAVLLTYLAVVGAYFGLAIREFGRDHAARPVALADSAKATSPTRAADSATAESSPAATDSSSRLDRSGNNPAVKPSLAKGLLVALMVSLTLPIVAGLSDLPGSLLGLLIIGFGLWQAWQMNRKPRLEIAGPFQVGPPEPSPPA